jgi:hypothetical protein
MTITFRIDDGHNILSPIPAVITHDQLGALRDILADQAIRLGITMMIPIHGVTFLGRRVRIWQTEHGGDIKIGLASNPDAAPELEVANGNAYALLEGLGLDPDRVGAVAMTELRLRLTDPRIRRRLDADPGMAGYVEKLAAMAALKPIDGEYHLAWA